MKEKSIDQFVNDLVAEWVDRGKITLRPAEKKLLKELIAAAVPKFLAVNTTEAFDRHINTVQQQQRAICVNAVADLPEPMPGLINRQRALNACGYADETMQNPVRSVPQNGVEENVEMYSRKAS